jgi:type IV pilus assembly protein PilQ
LPKESTIIKSIDIRSLSDQTIVEIARSSPSPYAAFKLIDPHRVIVDIRGVPAEGLSKSIDVNNGFVEQIGIQEHEDDPGRVRVVIMLAEDMEYSMDAHGDGIILKLTPALPAVASKPLIDSPEVRSAGAEETEAQEVEMIGHEPRIFIKPGFSPLTQILGIDFTMLEHNASSVRITTNRKAQYTAKLKRSKVLLLNFEEASILPQLVRPLDATYFPGAVERVTPMSMPGDRKVSVEITLKESVPYHISEDQGNLDIRFAAAQVKPPPIVLKPKVRKLASSGHKNYSRKEGSVSEDIWGGLTKPYAGSKMSFDFREADIKNVLYFIANAVGLNIIWESALSGKVSLKLDDVPWDQALEMILKPNDLTYTIDGDVMWVMPRSKLIDLEIQERDRRKAMAAEKKSEELFEPKVVEYITVKYRRAEEILVIAQQTIITWAGAETAKKAGEEEAESKEIMSIDLVMSVDPGTNIIIANGTKKQVERVRDLVERLDVPEKQVVIEARIVEATENFTTDLGVRWDIEHQRRKDTATPWMGTPRWAPQNTAVDFPPGGSLFNPTLQTFSPVGWVSNLAYSFTHLDSFGLRGIALDAELAFAESEGDAKIISAPKVVTRDAVTASIKQGTKIVIPSGTDENGNAVFEQVDASLKLEVTPKITADDRVIMQIDVSDDFPDYANAVFGQVPIATKNVNTTMMIKSGDTVVIGGIFKNNESKNTELLPYLGRIPVLGWFFKAEAKTAIRTELLVFITPSVVPIETLTQ